MQRKIIPDVVTGEQDIFYVPPDMTARAAAKAMADRHVAAALILENDKLIGIITERDLVFRVMAKDLKSDVVRVREFMTSNPTTITSDAHAREALDKMRQGHFRHLPVVDGDVVRGIVSIRDLYEAMSASLEEELQNAETLIRGEHYGGLGN